MHHDEHPRQYPPLQTRRDGASRWSTAVPLLLLTALVLVSLAMVRRAAVRTADAVPSIIE